MKFFKYKHLLGIFIIFCISFPIFKFIPTNTLDYDIKDDNPLIYSQAVNRTGKDFLNITELSDDCYINRDQPSLNEQPRIFIPNYNLSHAEMSFENITALNYTRSIENDFSEFIISSQNGPMYVYQKFAVEMDQYVNNVSILIQDYNDPFSFTDENSWELAIVNCLDDSSGTPNPNETLGLLKKPHPITYATHWEIFDFQNSGNGPVYLNTSATKMTIENGIEKYWFAFRVKLPADDRPGGGPKFLYFNPDEGNIGEGDTFAISPDFYFDDYTVNNVRNVVNRSGTYLEGDLNSFRNVDEERYKITDTNNITVNVRFNLKELKNSPFTFWQLFLLKDTNWLYNHYKYIFSFDIYMMLNLSNIADIVLSQLYIRNFKAGLLRPQWVPLNYDILQANESMLYYSIRNPFEKFHMLIYMDNNPLSPFGGNNTLQFRLEYISLSDIDLSINQFKVEVGELENLDTIQQHDPLVQDLYVPTNVNIINGSTSPFGDQSMESLQYTDNDYYKTQALTSNLTSLISFNVLEEFNSSLWDVDYYDWIASYPNPLVPMMDIRITSNVSKPDNLDIAALALYKGNETFEILDDEQNKGEWILMSKLREFANADETTTVLRFDAGFTWLFLNILNESRNNEANLVLVYLSNNTGDYGFNVSINEFTINLYIQNVISSDISSSVGLGISNSNLMPSDIRLQNFGTDVVDSGIGMGIWESDIDDAVFSQGFFEFNVTSLWHAIRFDVIGTYETFKIIPILDFTEDPASQYMTGSKIFSVRITEVGGKPLENIEIIFELLNPGGTPIYEKTSRSNEEGIAVASIQFQSTGERFSIRARFAEAGFYTSAEVVSSNIRIINDFILFMDNFLRYLPYIIIGALAIALILTARSVKHARSRKYWAGEAKILDDLVKISYIMIIHKNVGVSIYNKQISLEGIDSDLISGFLQAISQFRTEIKKGSTATKGKEFEMDYGDFKIVIADGDYVRVALILDGTPSENLKENQWLFTDHFEKRFGALLTNFTGDITPFRDTGDLVEKYFNVTLVYPLQLGKHYGVIKSKGLEKTLIEVAEQIQKERKFFFISSLLNYVLAARKASRDEIISAIIDLKRKGLIIPAKLE